MTPKEKAEALVNRFNLFVYCFVGSGMLTNDADDSAIRMNAKQCALIAVDEIINTGLLEGTTTGVLKKYWREVKQEIEKL